MPAKPVSPQIQVIPATINQWSDLEVIFAKAPCLCQYWRVSAKEYGRATKAELPTVIAQRKEALQGQLIAPIPPGIIAYLNGEPAGWLGLGPRQQLERLIRSRTIPLVDELPVWSILCFLVRAGYRRKGVASALLNGAIECAKAHGVPALEAYPVEPAGKRLDTAGAYVGTVRMFERVGFAKVLETNARSAGLPRWLMRLDLEDNT